MSKDQKEQEPENALEEKLTREDLDNMSRRDLVELLEAYNELLAEVKRLRFHLKDVVDELATHLGDYENEMYDWIRKMHELYGSD